MFLGLGYLGTITTGHNLLNLYYMQQLSFKKVEDMVSGDIFLEQFFPRFNEKTLFHKFATNQKFLKLIFDEIKK